MRGVQALAAGVTASRRPAAADNPFLALQTKSRANHRRPGFLRDARDKLQEQIFFGFYGSPVVQALLGINADSIVRPVPEMSPETLAARKAQSDAYVANAGDRRVRRGPDPGGALCHRRRPECSTSAARSR